MLVPQARQSRHNIRLERVVSENARSFGAQLHHAEEAHSIFERRKAMEPDFRVGSMNSEMTVFSDEDWAGDTETRKSSNAGVALLERHLL